MEAEGSNPSKETSQSGTVGSEANATTTTNIPTDVGGNNEPNPRQPPVRDDRNQYIPMSRVVRVMRDILPPEAKIADDAKETVQECVSEFINFITSEALEKCHQEYRNTISPDDVLAAMRSLGFHNYIEPLSVFLSKHRSPNPGQSSSSQAPTSRRRPRDSAEEQPSSPTSLAARQPSPTAAPQGPVAAPALPGNYSELPQLDKYHSGNPGGGQGPSGHQYSHKPATK